MFVPGAQPNTTNHLSDPGQRPQGQGGSTWHRKRWIWHRAWSKGRSCSCSLQRGQHRRGIIPEINGRGRVWTSLVLERVSCSSWSFPQQFGVLQESLNLPFGALQIPQEGSGSIPLLSSAEFQTALLIQRSQGGFFFLKERAWRCW